MINLSYEKGKTEGKLGKQKKETPAVMSRAINRATANMKTTANKEARILYHLKSKDISTTFTLKKASKSNLKALVISKGSKLGLEKYKVSPTQPKPGKAPKVLKVAVKKDGLKPIEGAFVADIHGIKIFKRTTKNRLPITRKMGPSVPQILKNKDIVKSTEKAAMKIYKTRLDHEIKRVLGAEK
ncbi:MAG: hypothetical protein CVV56_08085 [Tenericutes bacterium HGW-Tenericutes-1]|nr:MAG: hypothetical protein CVV56_08085 [Tenericutes bacterium HGW-Tenericutes-1]PKM95804.1 MAG: hypothetical protein CVU84_03115 [Firmicutes bacterium HGW-Firmicutes-1]